MTINAQAPQLESEVPVPNTFATFASGVATNGVNEDPFEPLSVGEMVDRVAAMAVEKAAHPGRF